MSSLRPASMLTCAPSLTLALVVASALVESLELAAFHIWRRDGLGGIICPPRGRQRSAKTKTEESLLHLPFSTTRPVVEATSEAVRPNRGLDGEMSSGGEVVSSTEEDVRPKVRYREQVVDLSAGIVAKNLRYGRGFRRADVYYQKGWSSRPTIFLCREYRNNKEDVADQAELFLRMGYVAVAMDYRTVEDIHQAIEWFRSKAAKYRGDDRKFCIWGYSAGGDIALRSALLGTGQSELQAAIIVAGARESHVSLVTPSAPPMLLVHSRDDWTVPFEGSLEVSKELSRYKVPAVTLFYRSGGHWPHWEDPEEFEATMEAFLRRRFGRSTALVDTPGVEQLQTGALYMAAEDVIWMAPEDDTEESEPEEAELIDEVEQHYDADMDYASGIGEEDDMDDIVD